MKPYSTQRLLATRREQVTEKVSDNLEYNASEAIVQHLCVDFNELHQAVARAMELCKCIGIPVDKNFKRQFKVSPQGVICDWKLSLLAYRFTIEELKANPNN